MTYAAASDLETTFTSKYEIGAKHMSTVHQQLISAVSAPAADDPKALEELEKKFEQ